MFGIKTKIINHFKKKFESIDFSNKPINFIEEKILTRIAKKELKNELEFVDLQSPIAKRTNPFAAKIIRATADYMPNNLGNWSIKTPNTFTSRLELNLVKKIKNLYKCNDNIIGHFGSGTTEGNIYATWIGRNFLIKKLSLKNSEKIVLVKSCLAHYSIDKAADIVGVKIVQASIDEQQFNLDKNELTLQLNQLYKDGFRGFIIPLTLGYTVTGTDDDYIDISKIIKKFKKTHKNCDFFLWLDAAFSGISKIFTEKNFQPFSNESIQLISTDFHKLLSVPYPASIMLYRKNLLNHIKKNIPYIDQFDTTLLGSRPGISILATWMSFLGPNQLGIKVSIYKALLRKSKFLEKIIKNQELQIETINQPNSLQAALLSKNKSTQEILQKKYGLRSINYKLVINNKEKIIKLNKLYFLPEFKFLHFLDKT